MEQINWKLRLRNKATLVALGATIFLLGRQLGIPLPANWSEIVDTVLTLLALLGVITDPTTKGVYDSPQAMTYEEPKA